MGIHKILYDVNSLWGENYREKISSDNEAFKRLSKFYRVNGTLPLSEEKIRSDEKVKMEKKKWKLKDLKSTSAKFQKKIHHLYLPTDYIIKYA